MVIAVSPAWCSPAVRLGWSSVMPGLPRSGQVDTAGAAIEHVGGHALRRVEEDVLGSG